MFFAAHSAKTFNGLHLAGLAALLAQAQVDVLLVGESLGLVLQGQTSTLPVTLEDLAYHTRCVARGAGDALVLTDLSFGSYQQSREQAFASAAVAATASAAPPSPSRSAQP